MAKQKFKIQDILSEGIKGRYEELHNTKSTVLTRARDCAKLTIPTILPPEGNREDDVLATPYQSLGARLVNNLASKLILTLLPPNNSFFRLFTTDEAKAVIDPTQMEEANNIAVAIEKEAQKTIEKEAIRVTAFELFKSLIITGNALGVKTEEGLKSYRYDQFVVVRDYKGNLLEVITTEQVDPDTLDDDIKGQLDLDTETDVTLYTRAVLREQTWYEYQYVDDVLVEGSDTSYKPENFPYLPLRWTSVSGHNYGIGLVEQYIGDFRSLEAIAMILIEHAAVAGKTIFGVKAGSVLDIDALNDAENGEVIQGDFENDLTVLRVDKGSDISYVMQVMEQIQRRLEQAFLSAQSVARASERTTAREISYMAADLEQSLGGVYSIMSQEFQAPLAALVLNGMKNVDMKGFEFVVVTGIDALGRNSELEKIMQFTQVLQATGLTEAIAARINIDNLINDLTTASSLPTGRYVKSEQQVQQEQQQAQQQQMLAQGGQEMAKQAGAGVGQQLAPPQQ